MLCQSSARLAPLLIIIVFPNTSLSCLFNPSSTVSTGSTISFSCADLDGGGGKEVRTPISPAPWKIKHKVIGFLCNTGRDPQKITKLPSQHSILGYHRPASETSFKWPMTARLVVFGSTLLSSTAKNRTPSDKTFRICACFQPGNLSL